VLNNFHIVTFNFGDIIFKQNDTSKGLIYIILTGSCSVMVHDGQTLSEKAREEAGDFVGEMAVLDENKVRSTSIVAASPVTLCAIDETARNATVTALSDGQRYSRLRAAKYAKSSNRRRYSASACAKS